MRVTRLVILLLVVALVSGLLVSKERQRGCEYPDGGVGRSSEGCKLCV